MAIEAFLRGHLAQYDTTKNEWFYANNGEPITITRPCARCKESPIGEGYDACLGYVEGAAWACCGHGVSKPYIIWEQNK